MSDIRIGIIGGTRGMGGWFARFLEREGFSVHISGSKQGMPVAEIADLCQVVIVSVPIGVTAEVIEKIGPHMRKDSLLMDLTSLKQEPVKVMLEASCSEVIGCHPLFGPQVDSMSGQHIVLCPARGEKWLSWVRDILERSGAVVVETTPEKHDRMMAIIQGLNHFNTVMMGLVLAKTGVSISELMKFTTPAFRMKMEIVKKVFCQNPGLYAEIITMNPEVCHLIEVYEEDVANLKKIIYEGNSADMMDIIEKHAVFFKNPLT